MLMIYVVQLAAQATTADVQRQYLAGVQYLFEQGFVLFCTYSFGVSTSNLFTWHTVGDFTFWLRLLLNQFAELMFRLSTYFSQ